MVGFVQILKDAVTLVRTDRRVWSAFGFVVVALVVWSATSVWRDNTAASEVHKGKRPDEPGARRSIIEFQKEWEEEKLKRAKFHETLDRAMSNINNDRDQLEWNANRLVDKLNGMTIKVDKIIADIGATRLAKARLNEKIAKQKSKNTKKVIAIDRSELEMAR